MLTEVTKALGDQLHMKDQQLPAARPVEEEAAQKDTVMSQRRNQQLAEAAQQLEDARSEILHLKEEAARKDALLQGSQGEIADLIQQVREG
jgi:hypothetical protein